MDCTEAGERLLEAAEGCLTGEELRVVEGHLARCTSCRAEFEELRTAAGALRDAVSELAPAESYLTPDRRRRLMAARAEGVYAEGSRMFHLVSYRRFIAMAAAAAILVSIGSIGTGLVRMWRYQPREKRIAAKSGAPSYVSVVLAAPGHGEPVKVVRSIPVSSVASAEGWTLPAEGMPAGGLVPAESVGVRVPVDHAYYDPEESSRWW